MLNVLARWLGWVVGHEGGVMMYATVGGVRVLDFDPTCMRTHYTHFNRATFQFDEILEQSIKIPVVFHFIL